MVATSTDPAVAFLNGQIEALHALGIAATAAYELLAEILFADPKSLEERGQFAFRVARMIGHTGGPLAEAIDRAGPWIGATTSIYVPFVGKAKGACVGALAMVEAVCGKFRAIESTIAMAEKLEAAGEQHGCDRWLTEDWTDQLLESLHDDQHYLPANRVEKLAVTAREEVDAAIERVTDAFHKRVARTADSNADGDNPTPTEFLTRVVTKAKAASLHAGQRMANPSDYIDGQIAAGTLTPPIGSGKSWRFDIREFPPSAHDKLR